MSQNYPTRLETRRLNGIARRFTLAACAERRADLDSILDEGVRFLSACAFAGMPADYVVDAAKGLHDQLSNLMAAIDRDLDEVGEPPAPPLEMCELDDLILGGGAVMMITFALCMADTLDAERVGRDGTIYYPKTHLNFLQRRRVLGCHELSGNRETACHFPTRAVAEKYKRSIGRPYFRVLKIAVEKLSEG